MRFFNHIIHIILVLTFSSIVLAQDTTLTVTSDGNIGIGTVKPEVKLHVTGSLQLDKTGAELDRLILKTATKNDPGRFGILFSNNQVAPFVGDDIASQKYSFYSTWGNTRIYDAVLQIHGKADGTWGNKLILTHDGTDGHISTDTGNLIFDPAEGSSNVGIGTPAPQEKLDVQGNIAVSGTVDGVDISELENHISDYTEFGDLGILTPIQSAWIKITAANTFTKVNEDSKIEIFFSGQVGVSNMNSVSACQIEIRVDDTNYPEFGNYGVFLPEPVAGNAMDWESISMMAVFEDLPAGKHTVSLWARNRPTGAASSIQIDPGNYGAKIIVKETW